MTTHDFDLQYLETVDTFESLLPRIPALPDTVDLDLWFVPSGPYADAPRLEAALAASGFRVGESGEMADGGVEATVTITGIDADLIWREERRATEAALRCGFRPDGWGFGIPPKAPIGGVLGRLLATLSGRRAASPSR